MLFVPGSQSLTPVLAQALLEKKNTPRGHPPSCSPDKAQGRRPRLPVPQCQPLPQITDN